MHSQPELPFPALAKVVTASPNPTYPGAVVVNVRCPFCRKRHTHGIPAGDLPAFDATWGGRIPHCKQETDADYLIHDPDHVIADARWRAARNGGRA